MLPKSKIIVWQNLNNNTFYVKTTHSNNYVVDYINSYNHKIVYIYDIPYIYKKKDTILKVSIRVIVHYLNKIITLLEKLARLY